MMVFPRWHKDGANGGIVVARTRSMEACAVICRCCVVCSVTCACRGRRESRTLTVACGHTRHIHHGGDTSRAERARALC